MNQGSILSAIIISILIGLISLLIFAIVNIPQAHSDEPPIETTEETLVTFPETGGTLGLEALEQNKETQTLLAIAGIVLLLVLGAFAISTSKIEVS